MELDEPRKITEAANNEFVLTELQESIDRIRALRKHLSDEEQKHFLLNAVSSLMAAKFRHFEVIQSK